MELKYFYIMNWELWFWIVEKKSGFLVKVLILYFELNSLFIGWIFRFFLVYSFKIFLEIFLRVRYRVMYEKKDLFGVV